MPHTHMRKSKSPFISRRGETSQGPIYYSRSSSASFPSLLSSSSYSTQSWNNGSLKASTAERYNTGAVQIQRRIRKQEGNIIIHGLVYSCSPQHQCVWRNPHTHHYHFKSAGALPLSILPFFAKALILVSSAMPLLAVVERTPWKKSYAHVSSSSSSCCCCCCCCTS